MEPKIAPARPWVKLHLAKQSETCQMPAFIVGQLQSEFPNSYLLSNVIEPVHDERVQEGFRLEERKFGDYVNRTYVYRVEILGMRPDTDSFGSVQDDEGGMG